MFIEQFFDDRGYYVSVVAAFVLSIAIHEFCHAFVADRFGDHTAKRGGFATLNPFKTMGFVSIAVLLMFGFTWGRFRSVETKPAGCIGGGFRFPPPLMSEKGDIS